MCRFKNSLIAMSGLATIAVVVPMLLPFVGFSSNSVGGSAPTNQTQNVLVVNTEQQPVPVSGTATVTGTVQAEQSGTWNVGINGTPTVGLANGSSVGVSGTVGIDSQSNTVKIDGTSPIPVRDVDNPARNVFVYSNSSSMPDGIHNAAYSFSVPDNKRLVIEQLSGSVDVSPTADQKVVVGVNGQVGGTYMEYFILGQDAGTAGIFEQYLASSQMRTYAEPGNPVTVFATRNNATGGAIVNVFLSGYLVDIP
jgi:hypothetical protein